MINKKTMLLLGGIFLAGFAGIVLLIFALWNSLWGGGEVVWEDFLVKNTNRVEVNIPVEHAVIRQQTVTPRLDLFETLHGGTTQYSSVPISIEMNLFDDVKIKTEQMFTAQAYLLGNGKVLVGKVEGDEFSEVVLVSDGNVLEGHILTEGAVYRISTAQDGQVVIVELDPGAFPNDAHVEVITGLPISTKVNAPLAISERQASKELYYVDLMVVYTPSAKQYLGNILARIEADVASMNNSLINSGVNIQIRLVHTEAINYKESGTADDLYNFALAGDGILDDIHAIRDQYQADLVAMVQQSDNPSFCGIAFQIQRPEIEFNSTYGFSVTEAMCMGGLMTFHHEIGHNMGNAHDFANSGYPGSFPYSYGYQDTVNKFRTIMAYNCSGGCSRIPYYSNLYTSYKGYAMGIPDVADNARSLNNNAPWLVLFREAPEPDPTATATFTSTATETFTPTVTNTSTPEPSPTSTSTNTATSTGTPTNTPTYTYTPTLENTATSTMLPTSTNTSTQMPPSSTPVPTATPQLNGCKPNQNAKFEQDLIDRINEERVKRGLEPLVENQGLSLIAREHSQFILCIGGLINGNGKNPFDSLPGKGEGLAKKWDSVNDELVNVDQLVNALLNDPEDRANLLSPAYSEIGVGYSNVGNNRIWTILFIDP